MNYLEEDFYYSTLKVKHILDQLKDLVGADRKDTIRKVLEKMVEHHISSIPILENHKAAGIITEKNVLKLANNNVPLQDAVDRYMSSPVICVTLRTKLTDIVRTMNSRNIRRVVVREADDLDIGIITKRDLLRNLEGDYNEFLARKLKYTKKV